MCRKRLNAELDKAIDDLTLFDDDLMSKVFDGNIEATELLLQIILERKDVKVVRVKGQVELKSPYPGGRNIKLKTLMLFSFVSMTNLRKTSRYIM